MRIEGLRDWGIGRVSEILCVRQSMRSDYAQTTEDRRDQS